MPPLTVFDGQQLALVAGDDLRISAKAVSAFRACQVCALVPAGFAPFEDSLLLWMFWFTSALTISLSVVLESLT